MLRNYAEFEPTCYKDCDLDLLFDGKPLHIKMDLSLARTSALDSVGNTAVRPICFTKNPEK